MTNDMNNESGGSNLLISSDELASFLKDSEKAKQNASQEAGTAGALTKNFAEKHGLSKGAIALFSKLKRAKDQTKSQGEFRDLLRLMASEAKENSFVGQIDAFDDTVQLMRDIADSFGEAPRKHDEIADT